MTNLDDVVQILKKEQDRLTKQMKAITAALLAFGTAYGRRQELGAGFRLQERQESRLLSEHVGRR